MQPHTGLGGTIFFMAPH